MRGIQAVYQACKLCNRPTPIVWFDKHFNKEIFDNDEAEENTIKTWMREEKNSQDLITEPDCIAGYEANIVILIGLSNEPSPWSQHIEKLAMSRCRGKFIKIP